VAAAAAANTLPKGLSKSMPKQKKINYETRLGCSIDPTNVRLAVIIMQATRRIIWGNGCSHPMSERLRTGIAS